MFLRKMEKPQRKDAEKVKTRILYPINFQNEKLAVFEINVENVENRKTVEKYCTTGQPIDGNTIHHDRFACLVNKFTNKQRDIYCFCSAKSVTPKSTL